jgi:hypothetical protein
MVDKVMKISEKERERKRRKKKEEKKGMEEGECVLTLGAGGSHHENRAREVKLEVELRSSRTLPKSHQFSQNNKEKKKKKKERKKEVKNNPWSVGCGGFDGLGDHNVLHEESEGNFMRLTRCNRVGNADNTIL